MTDTPPLDLVQRLRTRNGRADGFGLGTVCDHAADEIERLRCLLREAVQFVPAPQPGTVARHVYGDLHARMIAAIDDE